MTKVALLSSVFEGHGDGRADKKESHCFGSQGMEGMLSTIYDGVGLRKSECIQKRFVAGVSRHIHVRIERL